MPLSRDPHTSSNESATNHNTTEPPDTPNDNEHVHPPVGVVIAGAIIFGSKDSSTVSSCKLTHSPSTGCLSILVRPCFPRLCQHPSCRRRPFTSSSRVKTGSHRCAIWGYRYPFQLRPGSLYFGHRRRYPPNYHCRWTCARFWGCTQVEFALVNDVEPVSLFLLNFTKDTAFTPFCLATVVTSHVRYNAHTMYLFYTQIHPRPMTLYA